MINGVGYTDDGKVWLGLIAELDNKKVQITDMMTPDIALEVAGFLTDSAAKARTKKDASYEEGQEDKKGNGEDIRQKEG